ncbi:MAG: type II toxin-antitoxin system VapC family toxin [Gemmatimonadaceae bacterium]
MRVLVADASAIVEYLFRTEAGTVVGPMLARSKNDVHVPALCDVEVLDAIRRQVLLGRADHSHALEMLDAYRDLPLTRHGHSDLLPRALGLPHNFTAYDATYVALAELLEATLVTSDHSLVRAAVDHTRVPVEEV